MPRMALMPLTLAVKRLPHAGTGRTVKMGGGDLAAAQLLNQVQARAMPSSVVYSEMPFS